MLNILRKHLLEGFYISSSITADWSTMAAVSSVLVCQLYSISFSSYIYPYSTSTFHVKKIVHSSLWSQLMFNLASNGLPRTSIIQKLEKVQLGLEEQQKICDSLKEKYTAAIATQRHWYSLLKAFQVCTLSFFH